MLEDDDLFKMLDAGGPLIDDDEDKEEDDDAELKGEDEEEEEDEDKSVKSLKAGRLARALKVGRRKTRVSSSTFLCFLFSYCFLMTLLNVGHNISK